MDNYTYQVAPGRRFNMPRPFLIGIIIALGLLLIVGLAAFLNPSPQKRAAGTSKNFVNTFIVTGDSSKAYELTNASFQTNMSEASFKAQSAKFHNFFTKPFKEISKKPYQTTNSWMITYQTDTSEGKYNFEVVVVKEKNNYLVQYYNSYRL